MNTPVELMLGESFVDAANWADRYVQHVLESEGLMTKRSLPRLEESDKPWRADRPAPDTMITIPAGPPSDIAAFTVLARVVPDDEAHRHQKAFARLVIEPRRVERLGAPLGSIDEIPVHVVEDFLEATWLSEFDASRGIPKPERWKKGKSI